MNKFLTQKFNNLKLKNERYTPLKEDSNISVSENTPKSLTPRNNCQMLHVSRKLLQNNKSFKIHKRSRSQRNKKDRLRNLFHELQNKMQTIKTDIRAGLRNYHNENRTPTCITPNHKIRHMLGRTPTKLYSPFSIETPPPSFHWRREFSDKVQRTPVSNKEWCPSPKCSRVKTKKSLSNSFM